MIAEHILAKEFTRVVSQYYPKLGEVLDGCHVRVITSFWGRPARRLQYIGIYATEEVVPYLQAHKHILRELADNMGLVQVVIMNFQPLLRDPFSTMKDKNPHLWLELQWLATENSNWQQ